MGITRKTPQGRWPRVLAMTLVLAFLAVALFSGAALAAGHGGAGRERQAGQAHGQGTQGHHHHHQADIQVGQGGSRQEVRITSLQRQQAADQEGRHRQAVV